MTVSMFYAIENTYALATAQQISDGIQWYLGGNLIIRDFSDKYSVSMTKIAAAMAHLSPRIQWTANVRACEQLISDGTRRSGIMERSYLMALNGLNSDDPLNTLNGPKVYRFAQNLLLRDMNAVTVDVWCLRGAGVPNLKVDGSKKGLANYLSVEKAYQEVATKLGILPSHLQAICWIVTKSMPKGTWK